MATSKFVYMVMWTVDHSQCVEVFNDRSSAVRFANQIGTRARVVCTALRTMPINKGGPAFPGTSPLLYNSMDLRDYFAIQALKCICRTTPEQVKPYGYEYAEAAYLMADAMLKARKEK